MTKIPNYWNKAKKYLSKKDRTMKLLIKKYSDANLTTRKDVFFHYAKALLDNKLALLQQTLFF